MLVGCLFMIASDGVSLPTITQYQKAIESMGVVGLTPEEPEDSSKPSKSARRRNKKKAAGAGGGGDELLGSCDGTGSGPTLASDSAATPAAPSETGPAVVEKKLRAARKKLRQIDALNAKEDLNDEQRAKLATRPDIEEQIRVLEEELQRL